jgi:hypothetical protein
MVAMKALVDLFSTDYGLMSVVGIIFMIGMMVWLFKYAQRKIAEDTKNAGL